MQTYLAIPVGKARSWGKRHYAGWAAQLTEPERTALIEYQGLGYLAVNRALRSPGSLPPDMQQAVAERIRLLDSALVKSAAPHGLLVYRGLYRQDLVSRWNSLRSGERISDPGYSSTSLRIDVARKFVPDGGILVRLGRDGSVV